LLINIGDNPDRPDWKICRRWLRNLYRVHQRLCLAFPSGILFREPNGGDANQARNGENGFLFRIDYPVDFRQGGRKPLIIIQSASDKEPDWDRAFGLMKDKTNDLGHPIGDAGFLLAAPPQMKSVSIAVDGNELVLKGGKENYRIRPGELVRFRLRANPTRKIQDGSSNGKRMRVDPTLEDHARWVAGKLGSAADSPICIEKFVPGWAYGWRSKYEPQPGQRMQWWSVLFEGKFRMGDPVVLKELLETGIGSAKAFGFGLLSIARV